MSNTKFTPGPWKVSYWPNSGDPRFQITFGNSDESIADIVYLEADANLIKAAPDMYEALSNLIKVVKEQTKDLIAWDGAWVVGIAIDRAEIALNKANPQQ